MSVRIDFYSDILCIWGWVGYHINHKLAGRWQEGEVRWHYRHLELYGDVAARIRSQGTGDQAYFRYAERSEKFVSGFDGLDFHPDVWRKVRPGSSLLPHQVIKAVELEYGQQTANHFADRVREAFFRDGRNIGDFNVLTDLLTEYQLSSKSLLSCITNGYALGATVAEFRQAENDKVPGSPTWMLDNDRYRLFGNVEASVIIATVDTLLSKRRD
ncbi:DsbA family oxidoreductase [Veronia pacifica]|uniref:DSBA-like thioredoxin domain-containing protein n=1 Tax=Veronia pacifica TaxID=1080227 RepID=A0A1C3EC69_9GAMM|nr:DsbA family protein [Veronia pacifica]ODA30828.1 hypothetical protein A8L45_19120 [Veronia pacifica]